MSIPKKKPAPATTFKRPEAIPLVRQIDGKEWTFYMDVNEVCDLEGTTGLTIGKILGQPLNLTVMLEALRIGLRDKDGNSAGKDEAKEFFKTVTIVELTENFALQINRVFGD